MTALRHKYVVVFGSCCTADAIRPQKFDDLRESEVRLLWYQGRSSLVSMITPGLAADEFDFAEGKPADVPLEWSHAMVVDELFKRQRARLDEVIAMSDALVIDAVSAFVFPYLIVDRGERCFLRSKEWQRHVVARVPAVQKRLWELPIEQSVTALRSVLEPLYERQPNLRLIFHAPTPCFNDGVDFDEATVRAHVPFYERYTQRLYEEACRMFPRVAAVACGGEIADPNHYNGPHPFHYAEGYMKALRIELARLLG